MEVDSGVLIRADFYRRGERSTIASKLESLYGQNEALRDQTIEFGSEDVTISAEMYHGYSKPNDPSIFKETVAFLIECSDIERVCHVLTVAWLSDEAIEAIRDEPVVQSRGIRGDWRTKLDDLTSSYPDGILTDSGPYPGFLLLQCDSEILPVDSDLDTFRSNLADLDVFGIDPFETLTVVNDAYLISEEWQPERDGFLTLLSHTKSSDNTHSTPDDWESWFHFDFRRLKILITPLLIDHWLRSRKNSIQSIDQQSHGFDIPEMDETNKPADVRDTESELESLRDKWIKTFTATSDEVAEMKWLLSIYSTGDDNVQFEQVYSDGQKGYISEWVTTLNNRVVGLENTLERVQTKLEMIAGIVRDRLQSTTNRSNLNLQTSVERLTWLLLGLGIIQLIISARDAQIIRGVLDILHTALQTTPAFSLITLLFGFLFSGYILGKYHR